MKQLIVIGSDGAAVNTGVNGGAIVTRGEIT